MKRIEPILAFLLPAALCAGLTACNDDGDGGGPDDGGDGLVTYSGPQTGSLQIDLASGAVGVAVAPQAFLLSGNAVHDAVTDVLSISLTLRNRSTSVLAGTKLLVTAVSEGTVAGDGDFGTATPVPYVYYGPESLLPDASATRTFEIGGVTGALPQLTLDLEILQHGWIFAPGDYDVITASDASGVGEVLTVDAEPLSFRSTDTRLRPVHASESGRSVLFACRNQPALARLDLVTLDLVIGEPLVPGAIDFDGTGAVGAVDWVTASPDGEFLYAVVQEGSHTYRFSLNYPPPSVLLVKLDADSLAEVATLELEPSAVIPAAADGGAAYVEYRGRELSISADGTLGAVAVTGLGTVHLVDLEGDMARIDLDPTTSGLQGFDVSATSTEVRRAAISPDGSEVYVAYAGPRADANDGTIDVIDVATGDVTPLAPPSLTGAFNAPAVLRFGPDGRLYYGRAQDPTVGLSIWDPAGLTWTQAAEPADVTALGFRGGAYHVFDPVAQAVLSYDLATDALLPSEHGPTSIGVAQAAAGHGLVLTPAVSAPSGSP